MRRSCVGQLVYSRECHRLKQKQYYVKSKQSCFKTSQLQDQARLELVVVSAGVNNSCTQIPTNFRCKDVHSASSRTPDGLRWVTTLKESDGYIYLPATPIKMMTIE